MIATRCRTDPASRRRDSRGRPDCPNAGRPRGDGASRSHALSQRRPSVGARRDPQNPAEHPCKVTRSPESRHSRDLRDRRLLCCQECFGAGDSLPDDESVGRQAGAALEEARKVGRTHVDHRGELGEREVFVEVLLDALGNSPQSGSWQGGAVCTRCQCHHSQIKSTSRPGTRPATGI